MTWRSDSTVVLDAFYAAFTEGWCDPGGTDARRGNLSEEGIWLGELVALLLPDEPEALGLLALMRHAQARRAARRDAHGAYVPLAEQDPARWDALLIDQAEALLLRASTRGAIGRFQLEAAVQSAHGVRRRSGQAALDAVASDPRLWVYQPCWAARAALLAGSGEHGAATTPIVARSGSGPIRR